MLYRTNKIFFKGAVQSRSDSIKFLKKSGDFVIVKRGEPRLIVLRCPCGCGDDLLINLDKRSGPAWRLYLNEGYCTLFPSYWRDTECGSHFIIWNNQIFWCFGNRDFGEEEGNGWLIDTKIEEVIYDALKENNYIHYLDLADECGLIPWESLQACKQLAEKGLCVRGKGNKREYFMKTI